ncbi:hypothetical protein A2U01_0059128, partial [Trifolium medium]|nr:hypothetical protein [Trifolium medium]
RRGPVWHEAQLSRAYFGGDSNLAAVEGCFSESGSDADISESCQVLLELQMHKGDKSATVSNFRDPVYTVEEMSGSTPNFCGKDVERLVNYEKDGNEDILLESDGTK